MCIRDRSVPCTSPSVYCFCLCIFVLILLLLVLLFVSSVYLKHVVLPAGRSCILYFTFAVSSLLSSTILPKYLKLNSLSNSEFPVYNSFLLFVRSNQAIFMHFVFSSLFPILTSNSSREMKQLLQIRE